MSFWTILLSQPLTLLLGVLELHIQTTTTSFFYMGFGDQTVIIKLVASPLTHPASSLVRAFVAVF